jgi:putative membrane protein
MHARLLSLALLGLIAPVLGGAGPVPDNAATPPSDGMPEQTDVLSDAEILGILQAANRGEVALGEQAQRRGQSQAVRDFGARMVAEHSALDEQLTAFANQLGLAPAPSEVSQWLEGMADHIVTHLEPYSGQAYDVFSTGGQIFLHSTVAALLDWLSTEAENPDLRAALNMARPGILGHLRAAIDVRESLGDPPTALP